MQDTLSHEVPFLLMEWGKWARQNVGIRLQHPSRAVGFDNHGGTVRSPLIADTTALWVDQCVSQVKPQSARDALVMRYVVRCSERKMCRELRCGPRRLRQLVSAGEHQVGEALAG
jgi:hypothetical protein